MRVSFAAFASGSGSNLEALFRREEGGAAYRIDLLVTDRSCEAEERARARGCAMRRVPFRGRSSEETGAEIEDVLQCQGIGGVLLAGFLKPLPASVCRAYRGRILNIHPALLPSFGGKGMWGRRVHEAVLRSGAKLSGPTVHYVNERYDEGRILAQWPVPVLSGDTPRALAARVLDVEHILYPEAADALAKGLISGEEAPPFQWPGRVEMEGSADSARRVAPGRSGSSEGAAAAGGAANLQRQIRAAFGGFGGTGD